eukprot:1359316-Pleurochrysis_carterae.AAC.2
MRVPPGSHTGTWTHRRVGRYGSTRAHTQPHAARARTTHARHPRLARALARAHPLNARRATTRTASIWRLVQGTTASDTARSGTVTLRRDAMLCVSTLPQTAAGPTV